MKLNDLIKDKKNVNMMLNKYNEYLGKKITRKELEKTLNNTFNQKITATNWISHLKFMYCGSISDKSLDNSLAEQKLALEYKKQEIMDTAAAVRRDVRKKSRLDTMFETVFKSIEPVVIKIDKSKVKTKVEHHVVVGDIHFDGDNYYLDMFFKDIKEQCGSDKVHLHLLGDLIQGVLRVSDLLNNDLTVIEQTIGVADEVIAGVSKYKINLSNISVYSGNHDEIRIINGMYGIDNPNFSQFIAEFLNRSFSNIDVNYMNEQVVMDKYLLLHGHQFRGKAKVIDYSKTQDKLIVHAHLHHFYREENVIGITKLCKPNDFEKSLGLYKNEFGYLIIDSKDRISFRSFSD